MCDWCDNINEKSHVVNSNYVNTWYICLTEQGKQAYLFHKIFNRDGADGIKINYCPNCGRKLIKELKVR